MHRCDQLSTIFGHNTLAKVLPSDQVLCFHIAVLVNKFSVVAAQRKEEARDEYNIFNEKYC